MRILLCCILLFPLLIGAQTIVGQWTFDDPTDLLNAGIGNDLQLVGNHTTAQGPTASDGAVNIGVGSYYKVNHGIPANGGGTMVNEYSLVLDFKVNSIGQWYTFFQTSASNANDGDGFINTGGAIGVAATGYSSYTVLPNEWYRLVIAIDLGSSYKYYLDGQLIQDGGTQTLDGRFSIYPSDPASPLLLFADNDAEDNPINIAYAAVYNGCLNAAQANALGGYGHNVSPPSAEMLPFLQTPTPSSIYVCWHGASADESRVEYGQSQSLGQSATGTVYSFNSTTKWHSVKLENLIPDTEYFYRCHTGTQSSQINSFRTAPQTTSQSGHFRFLIVGDSQSNPGVSSGIINNIKNKLIELYGNDWHNDVQLLMHVGDTVGNGTNLASYITEHFIPFAPLSAKLPIMVAIGNHEVESSYYYNYRKYEDFGGPEGEKYYHFDLGKMRFICLNQNISTTTETNWLQTKLTEAQSNDDLDRVFSFAHQPAYSEIWPDGNNNWAQTTLLTRLSVADKAAILAGGHSHNYERGISLEGSLTTLICGGCGGSLDRWGMYANQVNYPNTIKALDQYHWVLVDVDLESNSYHARVFSMGNPDLPRINDLVDEWSVHRGAPPLEQPRSLRATAATNENLRLVGYHPTPFIGTRFRISESPEFENSIFGATQYFTDIYGDTGAPLWQPIELNQGIDLSRMEVPSGILIDGNVYYWQIRVLSNDLQWSGWSYPQNFTMRHQSPAAMFTALESQFWQGIAYRFMETSIGSATDFAWDFDDDGITDSTERDPLWTFTTPGAHLVTLSVMIQGLPYSVSRPFVIQATEVIDEELPAGDLLFSVYPNPFSGNLVMKIRDESNSPLTICVYDLRGRLVHRATQNVVTDGDHELIWNGKDQSGHPVPTGVYFVKAIGNGKSSLKKVLLLR